MSRPIHALARQSDSHFHCFFPIHNDSTMRCMQCSAVQYNTPPSHLYAESHDGVDNIIVILLERLDRLLPADASLSHDEFDVLGLESRVVDLFAVVLFLLCLCRLASLNGLALVAVVVAGVVAGGFLLG